MTHWLIRAATRTGRSSVEGFTIPPGASSADAWALVQHAFGVSDAELAEAVAAHFRTDVADLESATASVAKLVPESIAREHLVFPVSDRNRVIVVATADPANVAAEQEVGFASGRTPLLQIAPPTALMKAIDATYSPDRAAASLLAGVGDDHMGSLIEVVDAEQEQPEVSADEVASGPVVRLTSMILQKAIEQGVSDIHIQPLPTGGVVRYRIDGVLRTGMQMPLPVLQRVVSRIKILGRMNIADHLRPQDGRSRISVDGLQYDLRISTVPTRLAEKCVIRILDPHQSGVLDDTGISEGDLQHIRHVLAQRDGIFVVTGPTGSGKTTTLYAALREISTEDVNVMTVEDPVEYELPGLTQIQVESKQGVTFASALRAILRQDPDVIFVGEIRDGETASIAAQASLTGHLVLATLHTNDAVGAVRRFTDLGLDLGTLTETLRGALAQRLVRLVCPECVVPVEGPLADDDEGRAERFGVRPTVMGQGCERCQQTGYLGRQAVTEFMTITPQLIRLILAGAPPMDLLEQARADGMVTLQESAVELVRQGRTTLAEVERVIGDAEARPETGAASSGPAPDEATAISALSAASAAPVPALDPLVAGDRDEGDLDSDGVPPLHLLVVDDDAVNRAIARKLLEGQGYRVTEAADGSEALARLARGELFNLMVLDLDMPMLGGREVLKAVRGAVATAGLPVVVLTGSSDEESEIELMDQGADDYIRKPIDPPRFLTRVKAALRRAGG